MRSLTKTIRFPLSGVSRNLSYRESAMPDGEKVYGTPDAMNVRGKCPFVDRERGGTRPGLVRLDGVVADDGTDRWLWPNGEAIEWPEDKGEMPFTLRTTTYSAPDGSRIVEPHRVVLANASKGAVPEGWTVCCTYRARVFVAKDASWYCSRTGDATDWDYGDYSEDPARATAGNVALAGDRGDQITALIPVADSVLYVATARSLWKITGEPTSGKMTLVSDGVGVCGANAWCFDGRHLWILSYQGVFTLAAGEHPVYFSYRVPLLKGDDPYALLVADHETNGVMLLSSKGDWYIDKAEKSLWPFSFAEPGHDPVAAAHCVVDGVNKTLFRCLDGEWRHFSDKASDDDGTPIASHVLFGPFRLSDGDATDGLFAEIMATLAVGSADVTMRIYAGRTPEEAVIAANDATATPAFKVVAGFNPVVRPRVRGAWGVIRLSSEGAWAYESAIVTSKALGRLRP